MRKIKNILSKKITDSLDLPQNIAGGVSTITVIGNNEISINECGCIMKYEDDELFLQLSDRVLKIYGKNLMLKTFFGNNILVRGNIYRIEFEE